HASYAIPLLAGRTGNTDADRRFPCKCGGNAITEPWRRGGVVDRLNSREADMKTSIRIAAASALIAAVAVPAAAQQGRVQVGTLNCDVSAGVGMIIGSTKEVECVFTPARAKAGRQVYVGSITK